MAKKKAKRVRKELAPVRNKPVAVAKKGRSHQEDFEDRFLQVLDHDSMPRLRKLLAQAPAPDWLVHRAFEEERRNVLRELVRAGASLKAGRDFLYRVVGWGDVDLVRAMLNSGADPNFKVVGGFVLQQAVSAGNGLVVTALLDAGADPNRKTASGRTLLSRAIEDGHIDCALALIRAGASLKKPLEWGANFQCSPSRGKGPVVLLASFFGLTKVVEALIAQEADVNGAGKAEAIPTNEKPKQWVRKADRRRLHLPEFPVLADFAPDQHEQLQRLTPLMAAVWQGHPAVVRALLDAGADPTAVDSKGRTAVDIAEWKGRRGVAKLLKTTPQRPPKKTVPKKTSTTVGEGKRRTLQLPAQSAKPLAPKSVDKPVGQYEREIVLELLQRKLQAAEFQAVLTELSDYIGSRAIDEPDHFGGYSIHICSKSRWSPARVLRVQQKCIEAGAFFLSVAEERGSIARVALLPTVDRYDAGCRHRNRRTQLRFDDSRHHSVAQAKSKGSTISNLSCWL